MYWTEFISFNDSRAREEFSCILEIFPSLRCKELVAYGEYQSKRKALEKFERLQP